MQTQPNNRTGIVPVTGNRRNIRNVWGGQNFSKIDLTEAYLAYEIHPDYRKYLTFSTPHGLYEFNRLVYGISDAPAKWQKIMDQVLENIPYTKCIIEIGRAHV